MTDPYSNCTSEYDFSFLLEDEKGSYFYRLVKRDKEQFDQEFQQYLREYGVIEDNE